MRRFTRLLLSSRKAPPSTLYHRSLYHFAKTSRQIEVEMREQKMRNLNNKFKSLNTKFGLNRPQSILKQYSKPDLVRYDIQSLRECSNKHPDYLLAQLSKQKSQFYQVIEDCFTSLVEASNQEALQFLEFLVVWQIYLRNQEYAEIMARKLHQMQLDLNELFKVLKMTVNIKKPDLKEKIMNNMEPRILERIAKMEQHEYDSLFKILNFMRINDLTPTVSKATAEAVKKQADYKEQNEEQEGSKVKQQPIKESVQESFYDLAARLILRNSNQIPLSSLAQMVVHYSNNTKEEHDDKLHILQAILPRILQHFNFFTHDQIIAMMYSYLRLGAETDTLIDTFVRNIELLYFEISWDNKKRILGLSSSLPKEKFHYVVGLSIFEVLKGKKVMRSDGETETDSTAKQTDWQLLPTIYMLAYETNLITPELTQKLQPNIINHFFEYEAEDIALIAWLFTITPPSLQPSREQKQLLWSRLESVITGGFLGGTFSLKDTSMLVWALCNTGGESNRVYKQTSQFWKNIQFYIQQKLNKGEDGINGCCRVLWAYLNNQPLSYATINTITDIILAHQENNSLEPLMYGFQLTTIASFYHAVKTSLPVPIVNRVHEITLKYFNLLLPQLGHLQIMKCLKFLLYDQKLQPLPGTLTDQQWQSVLQQFQRQIDIVQYSTIMGVVGFTLLSPQGKRKEPLPINIVKRIMTRKKDMQQLKTTEPAESSA